MMLRQAQHSFPGRSNAIVDVHDFEFLWDGLATLSGPSGSGKTTLFRLLSGWYDSPSSLCVFDPPIDRYRCIRFVGAHEGLMPWRTVFGNLSFKGVNGLAAETMLRELGMSLDVGRAAVYELSFGMYKRVELGIAVAERPELLLLDELFSSVDDPTKSVIRDYVLRARPTERTWVIAHEEALRQWLSPNHYSLQIDETTRCVTGIFRS